MAEKEALKRAFLNALYVKADGDFDAQVSMQELGAEIGIEEQDAAEFAQEFYIEGLAEMKTLSGGMGITRKGLDALDIKITPKGKGACYKLGSAPVVDGEGKKEVEALVTKIKAELDTASLPYDLMEEIVFDLKTIEVQLLSPKSKTAVIKDIFKLMDGNIGEKVSQAVRQQLRAIVS